MSYNGSEFCFLNLNLFPGWTKIEVLLQQLYDVETDIDATVDFNDNSEDRKARAAII